MFRVLSDVPLLSAIDAIYAAALEPHRLADAASRVNALVGAALTHLDFRDPVAGVPVRTTYACIDAAHFARVEEEYVSRWSTCDPRWPQLASRQGEVVHSGEDGIADDVFQQEFLARHGLRSWIAASCGLDDGGSVFISSVRREQDEPFDESCIEALQAILPHLRRAASFRSLVEQHASSPLPAVELFDAVPAGLLLTDRAGRCLQVNAAFEPISRALAARAVLGRLRFSELSLQQKWEAALAQTYTTAATTAVNLASGGRCWSARLVPVSARRSQSEQDRLVLAIFEEKGPAQAQSAQINFEVKGRLTRSELEVLAGLVQGMSAKAIAAQRGASFHTVRTQITSILEKTGHKSQRELIAVFGASAFGDSQLSSMNGDN